jgi:hypothetical protein
MDALRSTRPIRTKVETPEQINEVFDSIAYQKTAAVLRMLEAYAGRESFQKAVSSYLTKYSYSNAAGEDFWTEVTRVTGKPVDRIMRSLVEQPGAPVLTVRSSCSGNATQVNVTQGRFTGTPDATPPAQTWTFPACFKALPGGQTQCAIVDRPQQAVALDGCSANLFPNAGTRGYYFFDYSPDAVRALARTARSALTPVERLGLLGDEWWMVRAGRHDIAAYLDLAAIADRLATANEYIVTEAQRPKYQQWIRARFGPVLESLAVPGSMRDTDERQSRRGTLLGLVGVVGNDAAYQRHARGLAETYIADRTSLPGTLAPVVLRVAAASGDAALYEQYVAQTQKLAADPEEYYRFFNAIPHWSSARWTFRSLPPCVPRTPARSSAACSDSAPRATRRGSSPGRTGRRSRRSSAPSRGSRRSSAR